MHLFEMEKFVLDLRERLGAHTLVETGTYEGRSTAWAANFFPRVVTIEVKEEFAHKAKDGLCKDFHNIIYIVADSRQGLPVALSKLDPEEPTVFWLDGHNEGQLFGEGLDDCPVMEELTAIVGWSKHPNHAILIDDAHCFTQDREPTWPDLWRIKAWAANAGYIVGVAYNCIAIVPTRAMQQLGAFTNENYAKLEGSTHIKMSLNLRRMLKPPELICRATAEQGQPAYVQRTSEHVAEGMTEVLDTHYGRMMVPRYDTEQTRALRTGFALDHVKIQKLISIMCTRPPQAVFVDCGANVGAFGFAMQPYCKAVYMFEAQRLLHYMLCGSIALNGWTNVWAYHTALSSQSELIEHPQFDYLRPCSFGSIEFGPEQKEKLKQERGQSLEFVATSPLDNYQFPRIDILKVDVEGMELDFLSGATNTILRHRPIIAIEHMKVNRVKLEQRLATLGYVDVEPLSHDDLLAFPGSV
jgi:FkbM family methyltransferase